MYTSLGGRVSVWSFSAEPHGASLAPRDMTKRRKMALKSPAPVLSFQKCTSKGIRRQGIAWKHRICLQQSICPVVMCPCVCSSEASA